MKLKEKKFLNYVFAAVMAAMIFVSTYFLKIPVSTPAGQTMLKVSNILVLLAGMLFGGVFGGLAGGIGNGLYDLFDPVYITSAPLTFIKFFLMAFVCGTISNSGGAKATSTKRNLIAAVSGALTYWTLYIAESIIKLMLEGSAFAPAVSAVVPKMITSGINQTVAVIGAMLLIVPLNKALKKFLPKFSTETKEDVEKQ
ncbi:MAG: ECF transporter S component [Acutalibacteraceae bacterium]|nr:ECF transporter S component [Acutalibacteraceae bacterium]